MIKNVFFAFMAVSFIHNSAICAPSKPDIIFVLADSLRPSHIACYGYPRETTPFLDNFARNNSVRFETVVAGGSWTQPAVMSLFTSVEPSVHMRVLPNKQHTKGLSTLADKLREAGYQTVGITANKMVGRKFGYSVGFDVWDDFSATSPPGSGIKEAGAGYADGMTLTRLGLRRLSRRDPEKPLFLFLFYMDTHWDFNPPAPYDSKFSEGSIPPPVGIWMSPSSMVDAEMRRRVKDAYDGEVAAFDNAVSNLITSISATPRWNDTVVVVAGDHGESFWERGWASHGNNLSDDELLVPLFIKPSKNTVHFTAGAVVRGQVAAIDIAPTILDLASVEIPKSWSGRSLKGFLHGGVAEGVPVVSETRIARPGDWIRSVRTDKWKIISSQPFNSITEVYDLVSDPHETNNLIQTWTVIPSELKSLMTLLKPKGDL